MLRTAVFSAPLGALIAWNWSRLEEPRPGLAALAMMVGLGVAPTLLPFKRWRLAAGAVAFVAADSIALEVYRPWALGRLAGRITTGFLDFYDVLVPFQGAAHP